VPFKRILSQGGGLGVVMGIEGCSNIREGSDESVRGLQGGGRGPAEVAPRELQVA